MVSFSALLLTASASLGALAAPAALPDFGNLFSRQAVTVVQPGEGTNNGYFYSYYNSGGGNATFALGPAGSYGLTWTDDGDIVAGKGWNPGSARVINYEGVFQTAGNAYLAVYGWTENPLVEYYILDSYGDYNPAAQLTSKGATVTTDGGTYQIYEGTRVNQPSIIGTATFNQYWSIRTTKRVGGTVTTKNHFNAWAKLNMTLGAFNYQILATEAYESTGDSAIVVS